MPTRPDVAIAADSPSSDLLITGELLKRAKNGDRRALDALMSRYRPRLERWASGRLPGYARSLLDTGDLVQETLVRALEGLDQIEVRGPGVFQAYVRQAILNRIRDQVRWARRRPSVEVPENVEDKTPSPLELAIGSDVLDRYERALVELSEGERRLLHLRVELDFGYEEIAAIMERNSPDAARIATRRALRKLAEIMSHER
jgi:RNA polymerase sigma-70 factor (ECF subfamily)